MVKGQRAIAAEMTRRLGKTISTATVGYWKSAGAPISAANIADPDKLEGWYRKWIDRNKPAEDAAGGDDSKLKNKSSVLRVMIQQEKYRKLKAENDLRDRKLIAIEDAAAEMSVIVQTVRQQLERIPDQHAARLAGKTEAQAHAALSAMVRQTLELLSRPDPEAN